LSQEREEGERTLRRIQRKARRVLTSMTAAIGACPEGKMLARTAERSEDVLG
jgi:hypothetical protein